MELRNQNGKIVGIDSNGNEVPVDFGSVSAEQSVTERHPVYDVTAWGAVGDGSTDDGPAIQNAIDAAAANGGGTLFFPEPDTGYLIGTSLKPKDNVWYRGEAWPRLMAGDLGLTSMFENQESLSNARWMGLELDGSTGWTQSTTYGPEKKAIFLRPGTGPIRDVVVQNCYVHDTPATALGIDSCINDWYINNRVEGAGTDGETTGSNGIGVGVGEEEWAPTYIIGNTILDTAEHAIILEQTGGSLWTDGPHYIAGNTLNDARVCLWLEQSRGVNVGGNTYISESRTEVGLRVTDGDGDAARYVTISNETFLGTDYNHTMQIGPNTQAVSVGSWSQEADNPPTLNNDNSVVRGFGKTSAGVAGTPTASDWTFAEPCHVRNIDDETLWRVQFGTIEQVAYGEPIDLTAVSGSENGQVNFHDGTGTPPFGLAAWDNANSQWLSQVDGSTF